jgi:uncharacterized repeat protein (TIGR02543 family)
MMRRKRLYAGAAAGLLLLFLACEMTGPESRAGSGLDGKAAVRIAIEAAGIQGRTVMPTVNLEEVTGWELEGGKSSESETLIADFSGITTTVYLETGTWNFTLKGYKNGVLILRGNLTDQSIISEETNVLPFTVAPVLEGTGTFKITITLPDGHGITRAEIFKDKEQVDEVAPDNNAVVVENTYPVGDYYFSIRLYKDDELYGVVSELVQVRGNLGSEKSYTLTWADLNRTYIITYYLNEGQFDGGVGNPGYYRSTDVDFTLPIPVRTDYTFDGWYDNEEWTGEAVTKIPQGSVENRDFYAKWVGKTYTVTFRWNDGTGRTVAAKTVIRPAETIEDFPKDPSRTNYEFVAWNTQADGSGSVFTASTTVSADISVYAQWAAPDSSIVTFMMNDGTETPWAVKILSPQETTISVFPDNPSRTSYEFAGWNTEPDGGGTAFTASTEVTGSTTVYAQWKPGTSIQIHLFQPGDPSLSNESIFVNEQAKFSAAGTGYESWEWYWDGEVIDGEDSGSYTLPANSKPAGVYELSVVVTTDEGVKLSARCRVTVKAK